MEVVNQGRVNYTYQSGRDEPKITQTKESNRVITTVLENRIEVTKAVTKKVAEVFEIITYKIMIRNITKLTLEKLFFQDDLPCCVRFIRNSIKINNKIKRCITPEAGMQIGDLLPGAVTTIEFKTVVLPACSGCVIKNYGNIIYPYVYDIQKPPIFATVETNSVDTLVLNNLFIQTMLHTVIKRPDYYPCITDIYSKQVKIKKLKTKLFQGAKGSYVLVIGKVIYEIEYRSRYERCPIVLTKIEGFSGTIKVPNGVQYCDFKNTKIEIEDYTVSVMNCHEIVADLPIRITLI
ncbi:MAG: hypothetical protein AB9856_06230 [Cellulosilyticaceae bacterium]